MKKLFAVAAVGFSVTFTLLSHACAEDPTPASDILPGLVQAARDAEKADVLKRAAEIEKEEAERPGAAFAELKKWRKEKKDSPYPLVVDAALRYKEKKYAKCLSRCKTALARAPQCADAYFWRGQAYEAMKNPLEAANEYRTALAAQHQFEKAQVNLDRILAELGVAASERTGPSASKTPEP